MSTKPGNAFRLRRYQVSILIILTAGTIWWLYLYADAIKAQVEKFSFHISLISIHKTLYIQEIFRHDKNEKNCNYLNSKKIFLDIISGNNAMGLPNTPLPFTFKNWKYFPKEHRLIYYVDHTRYFRSKNGDKILLNFICHNSKIVVDISPYQWCKDMRLWGCAKW